MVCNIPIPSDADIVNVASTTLLMYGALLFMRLKSLNALESKLSYLIIRYIGVDLSLDIHRLVPLSKESTSDGGGCQQQIYKTHLVNTKKQKV